MQLPVTRRFLVPILFVVFGGMLLTTAISYFHTKRSMEQMAEGQLLQLAGFLNKEVTDRTREMKTNLALWSREEVFRLALSESYLGRSARVAAKKRLTERLAYQFYFATLLINTGGVIVASSDSDAEGMINLGDRDYFQRAMRGELAVSTQHSSRRTGRPIMVVAAPIHARNLEEPMAGVLAVVVDIDEFSKEFLDSANMGQSGGFILSGEAMLAASSNWSGGQAPFPNQEVLAAMRQAGGKEIVRYQIDDTQRMAAAVICPETGWLLAVEADAQVVLAPATRLAAMNGMISLGILALVGVVLAFLRKALASLRDSEARYRTVTSTSPVGIATFDSFGRADYVNERARQILCLPEGATPCNGWTGRFETREGTPLPMAELPMSRVLHDKQARMGTVVRYAAPGGGRKILSLNVSPLVEDAGQVSGVVAAIEDVTERTRIQDVMVQTEKMLSIGGLAAGMAHEINNPLASILQSLQVVVRRLDPGNGVNQERARAAGLDLEALQAYMRDRGLDMFLADMREAGARAAKIVTNMLGFARKSGGGFELCSLSELLDKTVELAGGDYDLKKQYDFKHIRIEREFDSSLPEVACQRLEIEQVLFNIIKNAAQAMKGLPQAGEQPRLTLRTRLEDGMARVEIEDNGAGMSEEVRKRVFEPFFTTKGVGEGTGLGLSVAYFIVAETHKGTITVESAPGQGTRFIITLPLARHG